MRSLNTAPAFSSFTTSSAHAPAAGHDTRPRDPEWTIGEIAREFGVTLRALRFYESKGLIAPRRFGSTRYYTQRDRARVRLILSAKMMGFTLNETAAMIGRAQDGAAEALPLSGDTVRSQIALLESQRLTIDGALSQLRDRLGAMQAG